MNRMSAEVHTLVRTFLIRAGLVGVCLVAVAAPARADVTVLFGVITPSVPHPTFSVAWECCRHPVDFEIEYAGTIGEPTANKPSVGTIGMNLIVHTPVEIHGAQLFGIGGFGIGAESRPNGRGGSDIAENIGVGAKIGPSGQLQLRLDYRLFFFSSGGDGIPTDPHPQRFSVGLSLPF